MTDLIYFVADYYPWWGIPIALIYIEVANSQRRHGERGKMIKSLSISFLFFALAVAYIFFNGRVTLRPGMERVERTIRNK